MAVQFTGRGADWEPSVRYLLVLIVAEIFIFGVLRTLTNHGG